MIVDDHAGGARLDWPGARAAAAELQRLQLQLRRQELVLEVTRLLTSEIELDRLWPLVAQKTCLALEADRSTMYLVDHRGGEVWTKVASQLELTEIRLRIGVGLAGYVAATGEIVNIPDCYADPRFNRKIDLETGYRTRSMLVAPMRNTQGEIIGVFQVLNKLAAEGWSPAPDGLPWPTFDEGDADLLSSIAASAAVAVQNAQLVQQKAQLVQQTKEMFSSTVELLVTAMDRRNPETAGHSQRVALTAAILAHHLDLPDLEVEKIRCAALLHDIGKMGVHDAVLLKSGQLTDDEYEQMRSHAQYTHDILEKGSFPAGTEDIPMIAAQHHERLDGSGYPLGHHAEAITLGGRILAVADVFDALRAQRVYKPSRSVQASLTVLYQESSRRHLDPAIVRLLEQHVEEIEAACRPLRPFLDAFPTSTKLSLPADQPLGLTACSRQAV